VRTGVAGRRFAAVLVVVAGAALAACGVPTTGAPSAIPKSQVPAALLAEAPPPTTTTTSPKLNLVPATIYFYDGSSLQPVSRDIEFPATLLDVLHDLTQGPTGAEMQSGLTTAIPTTTRVLSAVSANGQATVNFNAAFGQITGPAQVQAVTQVVLTVVGQVGASTGVRFEIEGQPTEVPDASGVEQSGPIYLWQMVPITTTTTAPPGGTASATPPSPSTTVPPAG
jgi:spore germination protein GerM